MSNMQPDPQTVHQMNVHLTTTIRQQEARLAEKEARIQEQAEQIAQLWAMVRMTVDDKTKSIASELEAKLRAVNEQGLTARAEMDATRSELALAKTQVEKLTEELKVAYANVKHFEAEQLEKAGELINLMCEKADVDAKLKAVNKTHAAELEATNKTHAAELEAIKNTYDSIKKTLIEEKKINIELRRELAKSKITEPGKAAVPAESKQAKQTKAKQAATEPTPPTTASIGTETEECEQVHKVIASLKQSAKTNRLALDKKLSEELEKAKADIKALRMDHMADLAKIRKDQTCLDKTFSAFDDRFLPCLKLMRGEWDAMVNDPAKGEYTQLKARYTFLRKYILETERENIRYRTLLAQNQAAQADATDGARESLEAKLAVLRECEKEITSFSRGGEKKRG